jgi:hypothetical protein
MYNYRGCRFYFIIIISFSLLLLNGCGFKTDPYWVDKDKKEKVEKR